ncbi:hypothetical protein QVD17_26338 [Tagetes erecta]|uniref:Uncharacterized protein n=1 Tax=Tagetes erecta TaxID=13708 RepID=A0AAD8NQ07_TARER|nr:hypothetical protein QVD17_26338 [Tagetes erecta]
MKLYLLTLLVFSSFLTYKAQGINRKLLMTQVISSSPTIIDNNDSEKVKHDPSPEVITTRQLVEKDGNSEDRKQKDVISTAQYEEATDITEMDYTPARKKAPIHN